MKAIDKRNLAIRIIEYGLEHNTFTLREMQTALGINTASELHHINNILAAKSLDPNPNNILGISEPQYYYHNNREISTYDSKYSLLPTAYFSYIDHLEIIIARENAEAARKNAEDARRDAREAVEQALIANDHSREANTHSQKAISLSRLAVWITAIVGVAQIILQLFQMFFLNPRP